VLLRLPAAFAPARLDRLACHGVARVRLTRARAAADGLCERLCEPLDGLAARAEYPFALTIERVPLRLGEPVQAVVQHIGGVAGAQPPHHFANPAVSLERAGAECVAGGSRTPE